MNTLNLIKTGLIYPRILMPSRHIILLSHMRAYTSLLSHIIGSNNNISGYYELHISYFSWRSLIRQKIIYYHEHESEKYTKYMFDKILHNNHSISKKVLNNKRCYFIFMVRPPERTIQSIVSLYSNAYPNSPLCNIEYAAKYYKSRLEALVATSYQIEKGYIYIDAEDLVNNTTEILRDLTNWLHLDSPLEASYDIHKNTGKKFRGDSSRFIKTGNIQRVRSNYLDITIPTATLKSLEDLYKKCKHELIANSRCAVDVEDGK